jgi:Replication-relaxation
MRSNERDNVVDGGDTIARNFLIEELRFFVVDGRGRQRNENFAVNEGREFDSEELSASDDGRLATRGCAGVYVKHQFLRLAPPEPEQFRRRRTRRRPVKTIHPTNKCTIHSSGVGTGYNKSMYLEARARGRLFERPAQPRALRITERDLGLLRNLSHLRLASAGQLAALDGGSEQNVSRSLLALWEHAYVERALSQVQSRLLYKGSFPTIYGLTRKGAWLLRKHGYEVRRRLLYEIDKQRDAGWRFIEHRVEITAFLVSLQLAARGRTDIAVLDRKEILESAPKTRRDRRVRLPAKVRIDGALVQHSADPDELFGLRSVETGDESYFMFERDRGEMPVHRRKSKDQTYYAKKLLIYYEAFKAGEHRRELGIDNFRVATVTTRPERVAQMIDAQKEMTNGRGSNMFLFIDEASLLKSNPLDALWVTGKGKSVRIGE